MEKVLAKLNKHFEKKQFMSAIKLLIPSGEDVGLIKELEADVDALKRAGTIPANAPSDLVFRTIEMACEAYTEVCEVGLTLRVQKH